jgi:hypothetical protein
MATAQSPMSSSHRPVPSEVKLNNRLPEATNSCPSRPVTAGSVAGSGSSTCHRMVKVAGPSASAAPVLAGVPRAASHTWLSAAAAHGTQLKTANKAAIKIGPTKTLRVANTAPSNAASFAQVNPASHPEIGSTRASVFLLYILDIISTQI